MKKIRLRTFVIFSLVLHIVVISAILAILLPETTITDYEPVPISFGILSQDKGNNNAKDTYINSIPNKVSKQNETQKKNEPEKIGMFEAHDNKNTIEQIDHKEEKATVEEYTENKVSVSSDSGARKIESNNNDPVTSDTDRKTNNEKTASPIGNENMNLTNDFGADPSRQNIELAFPNYKINPKPRYPMLARRKGYEGAVLLKVFVLESGIVGSIKLEQSSGYEILDESALKAVNDWVFIPGRENGEPVPSWVTVPIKFQLNSG